MSENQAEQLPRRNMDEAIGEADRNAEERRAESSVREEVPFHIPRD